MSKANSETLIIKGALTYETVMQQWEKIKSSLSEGIYNSVDLKEVTQSDSASVAFLLAILRESNRLHFKIEFLNVPMQILEIAKVNGIIHFLPVKE